MRVLILSRLIRAGCAKVNQKPGDPKVRNNYTEDDKINADGSRTPVYNDKDRVYLGTCLKSVRTCMIAYISIYTSCL